MNLKKARRVLIVATISLLSISGCNDDKAANNQDDSYPVEEWTVVSAPTYGMGGLTEVVWSGTQFVAAGYRDQDPTTTGVVTVSPDGLTWTEIHIEGSTSLTALGYNGSEYLAASGWDGVTHTSTDGLTWAESDSDIGHSISLLTWIDTVWIAISQPPRGGILTSTDGETWIRRFSDVNESLRDIAWSDSLIVAVGFEGQIVTSPNAVDWTVQTPPISQQLVSVVWDGSRFLAVGYRSNQGRVTIESKDGIVWQTIDSGSEDVVYGIAASDRAIAGVGGGISVSTVVASYDGRDWTQQICEGGERLVDIVWNGSRFVAVGDKGLIVVSP